VFEPVAAATNANPVTASSSAFHLAFPVHNLKVAKHFYGHVLGLSEGRSSEKWQDYSLDGHQIVAHWVGEDYRGPDYYNPVDGDEVPVPHFGLSLTVPTFHTLAARLKEHNVKMIIEPHLRFQTMPGEQVGAYCYILIFTDVYCDSLLFVMFLLIFNQFF
jgi:extradiol dioxygenase family protein